MPKLTQIFVSCLDCPPKGQIIYRDTSLQGFGLRVTPGSKSYIVEARVNGVVRRITLGKHGALNASAARKKARRVLATMAAGSDPILEKRKQKITGVTLQEVLEHYLAVRRVRPNTRRHYAYILLRCLGDWLEMPVAAISRDMVVQRHQSLRKPTRQGTSGEAQANAVMRILGILLNFAAANYEIEGKPIILFNPVKRISQNHMWYHERRRQVVIPDHKLPDWYGVVMTLRQSYVRDYLLVLLFTGLRRNEAATLRWSDIDFDARTLTIRSEVAKNHREHRLPLSDFLEVLFRRRYDERTSDFVFPGKNGRKHMIDSDHVIRGVALKSGCKFTVHDLRRTFLTIAERLELSYVVLKKLANHSGRNDTTFGYLVVDFERLRAPMQKVTDKLLFLLEAKMNNVVEES